MSINRAPEYIALWKSHKRAEWEAAELKRQAQETLQQGSTGLRQPAESGTAQSGGRVAIAARVEITREERLLAERFQRESQRMRQLAGELAAELEKVAESLTPSQRKAAEKALQQWQKEVSNSPE